MQNIKFLYTNNKQKTILEWVILWIINYENEMLNK